MTTTKLFVIVKILLAIILIGTICAVVLIIYLFKGDIKARVPGYVKKEYNLSKYEVENRPVYVMEPKEGVTNDLVIMYVHGGSYVADLEKEHWKTCGDIINQLGCTIILPDYPLTPKYNYKDTINMMESLYKKVIQQVEPSNFVVMGDSAGGGLALALVEKMGEENITMPNQTILISPWLDVRMNNPKIAEIEENDPMLNKSALKLAGENYAGKDPQRKETRYVGAARRAAFIYRGDCRRHRGRRDRGTRSRGHLRGISVRGLSPVYGAESHPPAGGARAHALRQIRRHAQGGGILLRQSLLHGGQPRGKNKTQPERRRERRIDGRAESRAGGSSRQAHFLKDHDAQQQPPEDQRLPRHARRDRHRGDVAGGGHGESGVQRG